MARPRKPSAHLELVGAFQHDPKRRRRDAVGHGEIGDAPARLSDAEREAWGEIIAEAPHGVLTGSDRKALEIMCILAARIRQAPDLRHIAEFRQWCGQFGLTPASRAKVSPAPTPAPKSPFAQFARAKRDEFAS